MKNIVWWMCGVLLLNVAVSTAYAQKENVPYVNLNAGVAAQTATEVRNLEMPAEHDEADVGLGYRATVSLGYLLREGAYLAWRTGSAVQMDLEVELETGIIWNSVDLEGLPSAGADDMDLYRFPLMANLGFNIPVAETMHVTIGGGLGGLFSYATTERTDLGSGSATDIQFAWQLFTDFTYDLNQKLSVGAFYKVVRDSGADFDDDVQVRLDGAFVHTLGVLLQWKL